MSTVRSGVFNTIRSIYYLAAFSCAKSFPTSSRSLVTSNFIHFRGGSSSLFERIDESKIKTGWTHNQPKRFSGDTGGNSVEKEESLRTGWLHNKKAVEKRIEGKKSDTPTPVPNPRLLLEKAMKEEKVNHRMISTPVFHAVGEGRRCVITEHKISVPLDRYNPPVKPLDQEPMIDVYFSIVEMITNEKEEKFFLKLQQAGKGLDMKQKLREQKERAREYKEFSKMQNADDCLIYLQGGPGFGAPEPINGISLAEKGSWAGAALSKGYKKIILMDQRGTGKSCTITKQTLQQRFPDLFALDQFSPVIVDSESDMNSIEKSFDDLISTNPEEAKKMKAALIEATDYMANFRADNIVKDAEAIKDALLLPIECENEKNTSRPYGAALGQSFGGFCMMSYLSLIPDPPKICLLTGGVAPMLTNVDQVYHSLCERVKERNLKYYERYPGDVDLVKRIVSKLLSTPTYLPSGGQLTARRFLQLGISLGGSPSAFAGLHSLFSSAFVSDDDDQFSRAFLKSMDSTQSFDDHPLYFLMHESIYADKLSDCSTTNWSANRVYKERSEFDYRATSSFNDERPTLLTGEVVFPWMSDGDYAELSGLGMRALAHRLACKNDWRTLYDSEQMRKALANDGTGKSKAAAALYYDDMYVDFHLAMKVTARGGPLEHCKVWMNNDYQHSGLRDDGATIFNKLLAMAKGEVCTPS